MNTIVSVQLVESLTGHSSDVNSVLFSPNNAGKSLLASGSSDKTIRLWNLEQHTSTTLTRHTYQVHSLAFAPEYDSDGKNLLLRSMASVSTDGTCLLWDMSTISVLKEYRHDSGAPIRVVQFSPNGLLLATAGDDELINLWDITSSSSRPVKTLSGHSASIVALRFAGDYLVSGSFFGDLKLWLIESSFTGHVHFEREAHDLGVTCLDVLPPSSSSIDPYLIASGGNDNQVKLWQCSASKRPLILVRTLKKHSGAVMCVAFGVKEFLASGSGDKTIIIWNYQTGHAIHQFEAHQRYVTCCAFSSDGIYLASGSNDRLVNLWKITYNEQNDLQEKQEKDYQLVSIDQWTAELVKHWLEDHRIQLSIQLTGPDLLAKSDQELAQLFNHHEPILTELRSLKHQNFVKNMSSKKSNGTASSNDLAQLAIPNEFLCPITHEIMRDPVCISDGYTYERSAIEEWLTKKKTSPIMNSSIKGTQIYPNKILKMLIDQYTQQQLQQQR